MDEDNDVFQDFDSDASDFDDNVDLDFTDGESASILQLMSGADSTKKAQSQRIGATPLSGVVHNNSSPSNMSKNVSKILAANAPKVQAGGSFDGELLDEAFPESKLEITIKPTEQRVDVAHSRNKECEVEWALMALEEHEQLGRQLPAKADVDFLKLFEEMYGGDTAITLSTPSPPAKREGGEQGSFSASQSIENQDAVAGNVSSSPQITETSDEMIPAEILDMLQSIYRKAIEMNWDMSAQLSKVSSTLYLPDNMFSSGPISSFNSLVRATCTLERSLKSQDFAKSSALTREERLELILVVLDNKIGALPQSSKIKWAKMIDMLPLLAKMREQTKPSVRAPHSTSEQSIRHTSTLTLPPAKIKDKGSPLQGWATFHPEKMPARRCDSMKIVASKSKQGGLGTNSKKPRVRIREYIPTKLRVRCKVHNPEDRELTFRPKINKKPTHHRKGEPEQPDENFAVRMERDILLRRLQKLQQDQKREQQEQEVENVSAMNLIAKGSQRILLKNGMWTETLDERLNRLAKHRTDINSGDSRSKKRRQRLEQRNRQAAAIASRACESLYQRGIEQRRREQERLQEDTLDLEFQRNRPKISNRSMRVMKARIQQELAQLCLDSQHTTYTEASDEEDESRHTESPTVTFIQFSCALLYFGFVVNLNTPWEDGKNDSSDNEITLLWHSWTVFTRDDSGVPGSKLAMKVLERILFSVILGDRAGNLSMFRCRDVQTLLRLYRANYYARKHTQLNEEPSGGHRQNTASNKPHLSSERQINKRGTLRHRVRYSMHGKPIRNSKASETDMLSEREQLVQERINEMREAKAKQELEGCTFHPRINPRPSWSSARQSLSPRPASCSSDTVSTFERLYSDAFQRQNNVLEKYLESRLHREELEKRESKVQPSYVNGLTIEERLENLHVALAGNALPVNFHKKINAMRAATEMKALNEQIKEQRLQPAQFKRAKDGSTVVLPFQLATEIRAAMNTDLKKQRINIAQRPRDLMMKDLRPLDEKQKREVLAPTQPPLRDNCCEGDMCLDVHLSPSETHQLHLNVNDDPREVVERFAQRFSLTNTQRHFLLQLVEARLEQLTSY